MEMWMVITVAAVAAVLRHAGMSQYDVVHAIAYGEDAIINSVELRADFWPHFQAARATGRGIFLCGAHLSAFNLGFLSFALCGNCLLYTSPSPRDRTRSRMPSSA